MNSRRMGIYEVILTLATVGQVIAAFLLYNPEGNETVINLGWGVLMLSAVFGWLPILTFRHKGGVEGRGYIHTTVLVDSGIYAIVRHPQYLAGVLINLGLPMVSQHWLVAVLGLIAAPLFYASTFDEEAVCIEKFGDAYVEYQKTVPRMNFIFGAIWAIMRRVKRS